jgi:hypothetical protein
LARIHQARNTSVTENAAAGVARVLPRVLDGAKRLLQRRRDTRLGGAHGVRGGLRVQPALLL